MEKRVNDKAKKIILSICALVFLIFVFYMVAGAVTKYTGKTIAGGAIKTEGMEKFAKCLFESNVRMYGASWCSHCSNQKKLFGEDVLEENNIYIECGDNGDEERICAEKGIEGYPTWEIKGKLHQGEQKLESISELSGCKIE
jgi:glutaredoxin